MRQNDLAGDSQLRLDKYLLSPEVTSHNILRSLLITVFCLPLIGCSKYQTSIEAKNACSQWVKERGSYTKISKKPFDEGYAWDSPSIRYCIEDEKTRKWVGYERKRKEQDVVDLPLLDQDIGVADVKKRFSY